MADISFTSYIKPVNSKTFSEVTSNIPKINFADFPWSLEQTVQGKDVFTRNICDCTSCLLTNGKEALLMHINPNDGANHNFSIFIPCLRDKINLADNNLQGILVGSKNTKKSLNIYNKFKELLNKLDIPFSEIRNGKSPTNIAYKTDKDEIYISNAHIDRALKKRLSPEEALNKSFEEIKIADFDEIS